MPKIYNLTGKKFGRLTTIERVRGKQQVLYRCICDCGNVTFANATQLQKGLKKSCGCYKKEVTKAMATKHGKTNTRQFRIWSHIKDRCYDYNCPKYKRYGGRGIKMCDEWLNNFQKFYDWAMANGYKDNLTIDRIDNDGNYEPSNCRWVTNQEQQNNRSNNRKIVYNGQEYTASQLAKKYNVPYKLFMGRLYNNWAIEEALKGKNLKNCV